MYFCTTTDDDYAVQEYESLTVIIKVAMRAARGRTESIRQKTLWKIFPRCLIAIIFKRHEWWVRVRYGYFHATLLPTRASDKKCPRMTTKVPEMMTYLSADYISSTNSKFWRIHWYCLFESKPKGSGGYQARATWSVLPLTFGGGQTIRQTLKTQFAAKRICKAATLGFSAWINQSK